MEQILDGNSPYFEVEEETNYAGFWIRFAAALLDYLIFIPIIVLTYYNLIKLKSLPLHVILILVTSAYKPILEAIYGATLGKMIVKIKVLTPDLKKITPTQAFIRFLPWLVGTLISLFSAAILFANGSFLEDTTLASLQVGNEVMSPWISSLGSVVLLIVGLSIAFNIKKQGFHDLMAKTVCVKVSKEF